MYPRPSVSIRAQNVRFRYSRSSTAWRRPLPRGAATGIGGGGSSSIGVAAACPRPGRTAWRSPPTRAISVVQQLLDRRHPGALDPVRQDILFGDRGGDVGDDRRDLFGGTAAAARHLGARAKRDAACVERRVVGWLTALLAEGIHCVEHLVLARERGDQIAGERALHRHQQRLSEVDRQQLVQEGAEAQLRLLATALWRTPSKAIP